MAKQASKKVIREDDKAHKELVIESGTTEAEYQEPVVPVDPVDDYLQKTYPGLGQNIPNILHAILREIVIGRLK